MAILDSFVQGTGFIAAQLRYNAALRNASQICLVPLMQALLKSRDWCRITGELSEVVGTDDLQFSAWTRFGKLERKLIKAIEAIEAKLEE